jgi:fatty-acyl-CoA synthase
LDAEGWFSTGDVAKIDSDGYVQLTDRSKDVIKSGGEWISSIDLENAAVAHPDVQEAAVIGIPHPKWQERPLLIAVRKEGANPNVDDIKQFLSERVAKWWLPDDIIFVDELPHTATGKLHKVKLREAFRSQFNSPEVDAQ